MAGIRRDFIKVAAGAVICQVVGAPPKLKAAGPNDTVGLSLIGKGVRGCALHEEFILAGGARPLIACDVQDGSLERSREQAPGIAVTKDYREVLNRKDVDAVVIATPDHWHAQIVLHPLTAGKHVYCEKPLVFEIEEGYRVMEAVKKTGLLLQVGSQAGSSPLTALARDLVLRGRIGKVKWSASRGSPMTTSVPGPIRSRQAPPRKPSIGSGSWGRRPFAASTPSASSAGTAIGTTAEATRCRCRITP